MLGSAEYDPVKVGLVAEAPDQTTGAYSDDGYFILRTSTPGNSNVGHEFSNTKSSGVIGPALDTDQRKALIEFLKSM